MAKQANRTMIGGFVVLAVAILAASLVVFGSGKFFKKTQRFVLYFSESIKGLNVGAPVLFQGVQIGSVVSITIVGDREKAKVEIPVVIEVELDRFVFREAGKVADPAKNMPRLIDKGLRAMLEMQSLITGQLLIELNFFPDTPVVLQKISQEYIEIPTIPSTTAKVAQALEKIDIGAIQQKLESVLDGMAKLVNDPELPATVKDLKEALRSARKLIAKVDKQVEPLAKDVKKTVRDVGKLARDLDPRLQELSAGLDKTLSGLDKTLATVRGTLGEDAPVMVDLETTLRELGAMSRALRELASYLDQHPESLLRGKKKPGGNEP
jgi:paraquat-inducible protein B